MSPRLYIDSLLTTIEGTGLDGKSPQTFSLPENSIMDWIRKTGNASLKEDAWCVPDICLKPSGIWQGLQRLGQEKTLVYAGIPTGEFASDYNMMVGEDFTIPTNKVFLVFISETFLIAKFRFEESDPSNPSFPLNFSTRFTKQLWP